MSVVMVVEVDNFNRIFDGITVFYTLAAMAAIYLYRKKSSSTTEKENEDRTYTFKKKSKIMTWQQKMSATWKKVERTGFYEVLSPSLFAIASDHSSILLISHSFPFSSLSLCCSMEHHHSLQI
jgi:hypothetical protein